MDMKSAYGISKPTTRVIVWLSSKVHSAELLYAESRITIKRTRLT